VKEQRLNVHSHLLCGVGVDSAFVAAGKTSGAHRFSTCILHFACPAQSLYWHVHRYK
jgi:hypothetical protein